MKKLCMILLAALLLLSVACTAKAPQEAAAPEAEEPIFTDTVPAADEEPARAVPRQYSESEMRRFNRQVQKRNDDEDDDTI